MPEWAIEFLDWIRLHPGLAGITIGLVAAALAGSVPDKPTYFRIARNYSQDGEQGGLISVRCTIEGTPLSCNTDTSASPTPNSLITCTVSSSGLGRKDCAATFTALRSFGVYARKAC